MHRLGSLGRRLPVFIFWFVNMSEGSLRPLIDGKPRLLQQSLIVCLIKYVQGSLFKSATVLGTPTQVVSGFLVPTDIAFCTRSRE